MQTERLLHDSGKVELWVRLMITPFGLLGICGAILATHDSIIGASLFGVIGILPLAIWLPNALGRLYYDPAKRQLVIRGASTLWRPWRISLSDAKAVYVREVNKAGGFSGGSWVDIGLRYQGGRDTWIIRQPLGDPKHVAAIISEAIGFPIVQI